MVPTSNKIYSARPHMGTVAGELWLHPRLASIINPIALNPLHSEKNLAIHFLWRVLSWINV